jgi:hypothetical protein
MNDDQLALWETWLKEVNLNFRLCEICLVQESDERYGDQPAVCEGCLHTAARQGKRWALRLIIAAAAEQGERWARELNLLDKIERDNERYEARHRASDADWMDKLDGKI